MAILPRISETSITNGTGDFTLAGAETAARTFANEFSSPPSARFTYAIEAIDGSGVPTGEWEIGTGRITAGGLLDRTTSGIGLGVIRSTNANARVNFVPGSKRV